MDGRRQEISVQIWILVVGAMMTVVTGALAGVLSYYLSQKSWSANADYQARAGILQKRLDLIERTADLAGQAPGIQDVWQLYLDRISASVKRGVLPPFDPTLSEKLGEYNGQFRATLQLDAIFFGPKTRTAIASLKGDRSVLPYWNFPEENVARLLSAMTAELDAPPVR